MILNTKPDGIISIHARREEGDEVLPADTFKINLFLSTPSARRATRSRSSFRSRPAGYFYPRPPRGGRPDGERLAQYEALFLSTPSARRATAANR